MARFVLDARDERGVTVLLIEHHMDVITGICDRMLVLSYGEMIGTGVPAEVDRRPARGQGLSREGPCRALSRRTDRTPWLHRPARPGTSTTDIDPGAPARRQRARPSDARGVPREGPRHLAGDVVGCTRSTRCWRCAAGLEALGFEAGDARAGARRQPAAPVPRHARGRRARRLRDAGLPGRDAGRDRAISRRRRRRASRSPKTRSRSTRCSTCASDGAAIEHIVYDDPRGLASYPSPGLLSWDELVERGRRTARRRARACAMR